MPHVFLSSCILVLRDAFLPSSSDQMPSPLAFIAWLPEPFRSTAHTPPWVEANLFVENKSESLLPFIRSLSINAEFNYLAVPESRSGMNRHAYPSSISSIETLNSSPLPSSRFSSVRLTIKQAGLALNFAQWCVSLTYGKKLIKMRFR